MSKNIYILYLGLFFFFEYEAYFEKEDKTFPILIDTQSILIGILEKGKTVAMKQHFLKIEIP